MYLKAVVFEPYKNTIDHTMPSYMSEPPPHDSPDLSEIQAKPFLSDIQPVDSKVLKQGYIACHDEHYRRVTDKSFLYIPRDYHLDSITQLQDILELMSLEKPTSAFVFDDADETLKSNRQRKEIQKIVEEVAHALCRTKSLFVFSQPHTGREFLHIAAKSASEVDIPQLALCTEQDFQFFGKEDEEKRKQRFRDNLKPLGDTPNKVLNVLTDGANGLVKDCSHVIVFETSHQKERFLKLFQDDVNCTGYFVLGSKIETMRTAEDHLKYGRPLVVLKGSGIVANIMSELVRLGRRLQEVDLDGPTRFCKGRIAGYDEPQNKPLITEAKYFASAFSADQFNPEAAVVIDIGDKLTENSFELQDTITTALLSPMKRDLPEFQGKVKEREVVDETVALVETMKITANRFRWIDLTLTFLLASCLGLAVLFSILSTLSVEGHDPKKLNPTFDFINMILPAVIGLLFCLESFYQPNTKWASLNLVAQEIESETFQFLTRTGPYRPCKTTDGQKHKSPREIFGKRCSDLYEACVESEFRHGAINRAMFRRDLLMRNERERVVAEEGHVKGKYMGWNLSQEVWLQQEIGVVLQRSPKPRKQYYLAHTPDDWNWVENFYLLSRYMKHYGHCNVHEADQKYGKLVPWMQQLRDNHGYLREAEPQRVASLDKIGFRWHDDDEELTSNEMPEEISMSQFTPTPKSQDQYGQITQTWSGASKDYRLENNAILYAFEVKIETLSGEVKTIEVLYYIEEITAGSKFNWNRKHHKSHAEMAEEFESWYSNHFNVGDLVKISTGDVTRKLSIADVFNRVKNEKGDPTRRLVPIEDGHEESSDSSDDDADGQSYHGHASVGNTTQQNSLFMAPLSIIQTNTKVFVNPMDRENRLKVLKNNYWPIVMSFVRRPNSQMSLQAYYNHRLRPMIEHLSAHVRRIEFEHVGLRILFVLMSIACTVLAILNYYTWLPLILGLQLQLSQFIERRQLRTMIPNIYDAIKVLRNAQFKLQRARAIDEKQAETVEDIVCQCEIAIVSKNKQRISEAINRAVQNEKHRLQNGE